MNRATSQQNRTRRALSVEQEQSEQQSPHSDITEFGEGDGLVFGDEPTAVIQPVITGAARRSSQRESRPPQRLEQETIVRRRGYRGGQRGRQGNGEVRSQGSDQGRAQRTRVMRRTQSAPAAGGGNDPQLLPVQPQHVQEGVEANAGVQDVGGEGEQGGIHPPPRQPFLNFAPEDGVFMDTPLLDIPIDKMGVLAALPNSMHYMTKAMTPLVSKVITKLTFDLAKSAGNPIQKWKKIFLAILVLLTRTDSEVSALHQLRENYTKIMADEWKDFTLGRFYRPSKTNLVHGQNPVMVQRRKIAMLQRQVNDCLGAGAISKAMTAATESRGTAEGSEEE